MALEFIKLVKGDSPVAQVGSYGFFKLSADTGGGSGGGGDLVFSRTFSENTPEQIAAVSAVISANNMTSAQVAETFGWNIGDTTNITLTTGEAIQMRIIGFNHDDLTGGGKAGITLEMVDCLATTYKYNTTNTNKGGWGGSVLRNTSIPTIKTTLPAEWLDVIKLVNKPYANGGGSNYSATQIASDDLFILSEIECRGSKYTSAQAHNTEGVLYEYWSIDGVSYARSTSYWLRSIMNSNQFLGMISGGGGSTSSNASVRTAYGVSFAFCV